MQDTIFALASGAGMAGVAVLRLSGEKSATALTSLTHKPLPAPRLASLRSLYAPDTGELLDSALVLYFAAPHSFTGEDVVELHLHGGRAVLQSVSAALLSLGLRPAQPGEFSRRAFDNQRLDLTQAEAIADLVAAETSAQARQALRQLNGGLSSLTESWRHRLIGLLAHAEADIEFPEEDLPGGLSIRIASAVQSLAAEIAQALSHSGRHERLRDGVMVAIVGAPNAGKSSLINRLAQRDVAIVSPQAGTTRDIIEAHLDLGGWPVILADTAGLRQGGDAIEDEGIRRARARAAQSEITLAVFDSSQPPDSETLALLNPDTLIIANKSDIMPITHIGDVPAIAVSAKSGEGINTLLQQLQSRVAALYDTAGQINAPITRERHRHALEDTLQCLQRALAAEWPELAAEDIRLAVRSLGRVAGTVDVEDVLDRLFRDFCIGK